MILIVYKYRVKGEKKGWREKNRRRRRRRRRREKLK